MNKTTTTNPILTRRSDGASFEITKQARSANGAVALRGVEPPHVCITTTNDRLNVDFDDPRTPSLIPSPSELFGRATNDHASRVRSAINFIVTTLRHEPTEPAFVREHADVIADVALAMRAAGWECSIETGGARDGGKTNGLTVRAP